MSEANRFRRFQAARASGSNTICVFTSSSMCPHCFDDSLTTYFNKDYSLGQINLGFTLAFLFHENMHHPEFLSGLILLDHHLSHEAESLFRKKAVIG